ncbi:transmembrane protein 174 [Scleropages formosus]|nr:transmembrane protein 174 [Scleropages formosus]
MDSSSQGAFNAASSCSSNGMDFLHEDFPRSVFPATPCPSPRTDVEVSGGGKARATLLCSGVFLGLVGMTFTVMGWINYDRSRMFEWTQLLGPVLLSVGVTFVFIGLCKVKKLNCKFWNGNDEQPIEADQLSPAQSFVFTGISQPITFHGATVVQYIPPPCAIPAHDPSATNGIQPGPLPVATCPPQYYTIYPLDNDNCTYPGDEVCAPRLWVHDGYSRYLGPAPMPEPRAFPHSRNKRSVSSA